MLTNENDIPDNVSNASIDDLDSIEDDDLWAVFDNCIEAQNTSANEVCKSCESANLLFDSNRYMYVCGDCGMEASRVYDTKPEWGNEDGNDAQKYNMITNDFCPRATMTTVIKNGPKSLSIYHMWHNGLSYKNRALLEVLKNIEINMRKYKITKNIIESAKHYYKRITDLKHSNGSNIIIRGINRRTLIAACAYYATRNNNEPRTPEEIADIFCLDVKKINEGIRKYREMTNYEIEHDEFKMMYPEHYILRLGKKMNLKQAYVNLAIKISKNIQRIGISSNHKETSVAICSIYAVIEMYGLPITKRQLAQEYGVSEVTINKTYSEIKKFGRILSSNSATDKVLEKMNAKTQEEHEDMQPEEPVAKRRGRPPKKITQ